MADWADAVSIEDLAERKASSRDRGDDAVLVLRSDQQIFAIGNQCTHQGAGLDRGVVKIAGSVKTVTCPAHGSMFNLETGKVDAAAGHEAGAGLRREGRGRARLRSVREPRARAGRSSGLPSEVRTRAERSGSLPAAAARGLAVPGTAPAARASARRCRVGSPASAHVTRLGHVVVTDGDRVGVAERQAGHLGRCPWAHARDRLETASGFVGRHLGERLERRRPRTHRSYHLRAASLDPPRVEPEVRELSHVAKDRAEAAGRPRRAPVRSRPSSSAATLGGPRAPRPSAPGSRRPTFERRPARA